jgi:iron complex outermembrane receptor protein
LWGANAVNGVVNIVTKKASETQGGFEQIGGGGEFEGFAAWRYGGKLADVGHYRVYAKTTHYNEQEKSGGGDGNDRWQHDQAGFRTDMRLGDSAKLTLQGDFYKEEINNSVNTAKDEANSGHNLLARWNYQYADQSDTEIQFYYDQTSRDNRFNFAEDRDTYNIEAKHRFVLLDIHEFVVGAGYQITSDKIVNYLPASLAFYPDNRSDETWDFFIQDQISLIPDRLKLTLGAKFESNDYTGDELQPSGRLSFILNERNTVWGAVSQSVRITNRLDHDITFFSGALAGNDGFKSEQVIAYEFGYRSILGDSVSLDLALFYNKYTDLRGLSDNFSAPQSLPVLIVNAGDGQSQGGELVVHWSVAATLKILASYQYLDLDIAPRAGSRDASIADADESDPNSQFSITADWDISENWSLQSTVRRVGSLDDQNVDAYTGLNLSLKWQATKDIDLSLVGSNLLDPQHPEFSGGVEIVRSVHGQITWHF